MPRRKVAETQLSLLEPRVKTAPCVPAIRQAVDEWRAANYKGVTDTTRILLNYWFHTDHRLPNGRAFRYFDAQKFAVETLIYLYEVAGIRCHKDLVEKYAGTNKDLRLLQYDEFAPYCIKMATGSGKTKVMALAIYVTVQTFVKALRPLVVQELTPYLKNAGHKLSETPPFPYSRPTIKASKTVFNLVPCANKFEQAFAKFLEEADDVVAFSKLPEQFGFAIEYTDATNNLRYYEPDFVAVAANGVHYVIETKGREDVDVANKDRAATLWAENATRLTGTEWRYVKVPQKEFETLQPNEFADVLVFAPVALL